ncbi:hypothetical protein ACFTQ7_04130, partial [Lysinibacillus sp. NPDC056959]|uniref:hypothetical protein n=1 Tax=Lysinibacillus sp. NPDC056959 TaxID=3345981 RepID=UPI003638CADC
MSGVASRLDTTALSQSVQRMGGVASRLDTTALSQATEATKRLSRVASRFDTTALSQATEATKRLSGVVSRFDTTALSQATEATKRLSGVVSVFNASALSQATEVAQGLKGITKAFQGSRYNFAIVMASSVYLEDLTSLENADITDDYYSKLFEILVEWYTALISNLQQIWNIITTDTAMDIMTVASFIMGLVGTIIAIKGVFSDDANQTPQIHIHNYSDDLEIETKTEGNQVDIFIQEKK